jgi:hypothetical protein
MADLLDAIELLTQDAISFALNSPAPQWGIYLNGAPVVVADNVVSFDYREQWKIANFPLEEGAFESYNKVATPFDVRLRFSTGGNDADRQAMIQSIAAAIASTDLYDAVTPEATYQNVNIVHQDYRRTASNGAGLLVIDVYCEQVRVTTSTQFVNSQGSGGQQQTTTEISVRPGGTSTSAIVDPQSPSASPQASGGTVQPSPVSSEQQSAVDSVLAQSKLPF